MIRKIQALVGLTIFVACATATQPSKSSPKATVPASQSEPVVETLHGVTVADPYRWLEDQESPATRDWASSDWLSSSGIDETLIPPPGPADGSRDCHGVLAETTRRCRWPSSSSSGPPTR